MAGALRCRGASEDRVLAAQRDLHQGRFEAAKPPVNGLGEVEKVAGTIDRESPVANEAARLAGAKQDGIRIHARAADNQAGYRVKGVVLHDGQRATWLQHAAGFAHHGGTVRRRNVVKHADGGDQIEGGGVEGNPAGIGLNAGRRTTS